MAKENKRNYYFCFLLVILLHSCGKDEIFNESEKIINTLPELTTNEITSITSLKAKSGGNVKGDGGTPVLTRGVCWATNTQPTIYDSKTTDGKGLGAFTSTITSLTPGSKYYVRAYATNSVGTNYGDTISFSANPVLPILTTIEIDNITNVTASSGGNISFDGGANITNRGVCWSRNSEPMIYDSRTYDFTGSGLFVCKLTGLDEGTKYFVRSFATNMVGTSYGNQISFTTTKPEILFGNLTFNGLTYTTVVIGTQEWTVENLRTTTYNDGTSITKVTDNKTWLNLTIGAYCAYNNQEINVEKYGYLYNWYSVNTGMLAPETGGWRVPTDSDWSKLFDFLGGSSIAGRKLKAKYGWENGGNGTDVYGFKAFPGSYRNDGKGDFDFIGYVGYWWSSTADEPYRAWGVQMVDIPYSATMWNITKKNGFSIRLVRDK